MRNLDTTAPMPTGPGTIRDSEPTLVQVRQPFGVPDATLCSREHTLALAPPGGREPPAMVAPQSPQYRAPIPKITPPWPATHQAYPLPHSPVPHTVIALVQNPMLDMTQYRSDETVRCRPRTGPDRSLARAIMLLCLGVVAGVLIATCAHPFRSGAARFARHISALQAPRA